MSQPQMIVFWSSNVATLKAEGAEVRAYCGVCGYETLVDLAKVAAKHGEMFSFWNRFPRCPAKTEAKRCAGRLFFIASRPGSGVWPTNMRTDDIAGAAVLHRVWKADREAIRRADETFRFAMKRRRRRSKVREAARRLMLLPRDAALETVFSLQAARNAEDLDFQAEVRLEVLHRLERKERVDLEADAGVEPMARSR